MEEFGMLVKQINQCHLIIEVISSLTNVAKQNSDVFKVTQALNTDLLLLCASILEVPFIDLVRDVREPGDLVKKYVI